MPAALIKVAVYDPRSKRTRTRSFSWGGRTGRTEDEARKMAGEWEAAQRAELAGVARGPYGRPRGGKKAAESVNQLAAPSDPILAIPPPMPRQPLRLQLPEGASTLALVGSSRSGKTTLAIKLISDYYAKRLGVLFCVNAHAPIYGGLPRGFLRASDFYPSVVKSMHKINKISGNKWPFLVYLDDMVDERVKNSDEVRRFTVYRNSNISWLFASRIVACLVKRIAETSTASFLCA